LYNAIYHIFTSGPTPHAHLANYYTFLHGTFVLLALLFSVMLLNTLPLPVLLFFSRRPVSSRLALRKPSIPPLSCIIFALGAVAFSHLVSAFCFYAHLNSPTLARLSQLIHQSLTQAPLSCLLLIGVICPISEELLFRGYIQTRLIRRLGPIPGILLASLAFGIFHHDLLQGTFAFLIGIFLGTVAYRAQSTLPAILMHIAVNSSAVLFAYTSTSPTFPVPFTIAASLIFPATLYLLLKTPSPLPPF
jgi:membrane protease YdiL (CAAX protease family)